MWPELELFNRWFLLHQISANVHWNCIPDIIFQRGRFQIPQKDKDVNCFHQPNLAVIFIYNNPLNSAYVFKDSKHLHLFHSSFHTWLLIQICSMFYTVYSFFNLSVNINTLKYHTLFVLCWLIKALFYDLFLLWVTDFTVFNFCKCSHGEP